MVKWLLLLFRDCKMDNDGASTENICIFKDTVHLCNSYNKDTLKSITDIKLDKIKTCSGYREDRFYETIKENVEGRFYHSGCYANYTSKDHINRYLKKSGKRALTGDTNPNRKRTRSSLPSFDFKLHCLFCGEFCQILPDPKNPSRWEKAFLCRTTDRGGGKKSFKEVILQVCEERDDEQAVSVRFRIHGSSSDLPAAEARYHNKCRISFIGESNIKVAGNQYRQDTTENKAFLTVTNSIKNDINRAWTSVEIHKLYTANNGFSMTRKTLMNKIEEHLTEETIVLPSPVLRKF